MSTRARGVFVAAVTILLLAAGVIAAPAVPVEVTGAVSAEFDARTGIWVLRGRPVVIVRGATRLEAAEVRYHEASGAVVATGGVRLQHETTVLVAPRVEGRLREETAVATGQVVVTVRQDRNSEAREVRLRAGRVDANLRARRLQATGQPILTSGDASLQATRLDYDQQSQMVVGTGGTELVLPEGRLTAGFLRVFLSREQAEADGDVRLVVGEIRGESPQAALDWRARLAVLKGGAVARRGNQVLSAQQITVDLRARTIVATGGPRLIIEGEPAK